VASEIVYTVPDPLKSDRLKFAGKKTIVVGSGHSAITTLSFLLALKNKTQRLKSHGLPGEAQILTLEFQMILFLNEMSYLC